jgi:hypothetical protein
MKDRHIIGVDPATKDGDWTAEVEGQRIDGKLHITDARLYRDTIDLTATNVTDKKRVTKQASEQGGGGGP